MATALDFQRMLRGAASPVTRPRVAVPSAPHAHPHAGTDEIIGAVRRTAPEVSHRVGRGSAALTGLMRRTPPLGCAARREPWVSDHHHSGATADVDRVVSAAPRRTPPDDHGFSIDEAGVSS